MAVAAATSFYVEQVRDITVICFTFSELTESNYELVSDELFELVPMITNLNPIQVVVEMSAIRLVDELGLAMLQALHDCIEESGGTIILCRVTPTVSAAIYEAGLQCEFDIRGTRGEAIWSF